LIPLFNWEADAARAAQAWDGFLTWGRWSDPLVERLQPFILQTFAHIDAIGDKHDAFVSGLASVAAFSTVDPWHANGWLFEFMRVVGPDHRAQWATDFGQYTESLSVEGIDSLWTRWLSDYWQSRITGVPRPLDEEERQAVVTWLPPLRHRIPSAVDRVMSAPPTSLSHLVFYSLHESGIADTHGPDIGRFLRALLQRLTSVIYDTGEVAMLVSAAADHGADRADLLAIAQEMARLGCTGASELRDRANR
jgi:hypothetical protein